MKEDISRTVVSDDPAFDKERKYWLNQLAGELVNSRFPYDFVNPAPGAAGHEREVFQSRFPADLSRRLWQLANQSDRNLYVILLAGLTALLYKYTGYRDIVLFAPIYRQEKTGEFINTVLAIRNRLHRGMTFKELLVQSKNNLREANENLNYPIESLLYHLGISSSGGDGAALSETAILSRRIHCEEYIEPVSPNILFSFSMEGEIIEGSVEYNPRLYKRETIEKIVACCAALLGECIKNPGIPVFDIEIISNEERRRLLVEWNRTGMEYPGEKTVHRLFEEQVEKTPDGIAAAAEGVQPAGNRGFLSLCYRELNEKANQLARVLRRKGAAAGSVVCIAVDPCAEMLPGILAVLKAGAGYLPLEPEYMGARTSYMLTDSGVRLVLTRTPFAAEIQTGSEVVDLEDQDLYRGDGTNLPGTTSPEGLIYMIYTSGTSGKPKGVLLQHRNLVNYVTWFARTREIGEKEKAVLTSSFAFDLGYTVLYPSILTGGQLYIPDRDTYLLPERLLAYIKENAVTYMKMTPSFFSVIVNSPAFSTETCASLRFIILGGEPVITRDLEQSNRICPHIRLINHYGPTETTIGSIARVIDFHRFEAYKQTPTIGKPIMNTRVYILDKDLKLTPTGIPGELCIGGDGVGKGYLNRPLLTAEKFIPSPFPGNGRLYRTGDQARWLPDGHIEFLGRIDNQVKIRGFRIEPGEIENQLLEHAGIREAAVVATGEDMNRYLCAYIAADDGTETSGLKAYLSRTLPPYMIPEYFVQLEKIPLTPNGKLDRNALPKPEIRASQQYAAPRNEVERKLLVIWEEILGVEETAIGIDGNFFELGGHSLNATTMVSRIHREFNVNVPLVEIFKRLSIRELGEYIKNASEGEYMAINPAEQREYYELSLPQRRFYIQQQLEPESVSYSPPKIIILEGPLEREKLEEVFRY